MCTQQELTIILRELMQELTTLFGTHLQNALLFGSYARGEASNDSDVDILVLVDLSREEILPYHWRVGELAADLLFEHGVVVAPLVENSIFFEQQASIQPFLRTVLREGVRIGA